MVKITPIILAGGLGERLWPVSRKSYPKQFSIYAGAKTLFQNTLLRFESSDVLNFNKSVTITHSDYRFYVNEQYKQLSFAPESILLEPEMKNTAPSVLAACLHCLKLDSDATVIISPSDHQIDDTGAFQKSVQLGLSAVEKGRIVTFGIKPESPESGYGYIGVEKFFKDTPMTVCEFVEKPIKSKAQALLNSERYLWNSGIFLCKAEVLIQAFRQLMPDLIKSVRSSLENSKKDLNFVRLDEKAWSTCINQSVDYGVMEKSQNIDCVYLDAGWSDLGGWKAIFDNLNKKDAANSYDRNATTISCENSVIHSEDPSIEIVGIGLKDIVAVATKDAVLVSEFEHLSEIKNAVKILKNENKAQASFFSKEYRPWGWFEVLTASTNFQVKKIFVKGSSRLSLQSHKYRSEHWVVVFGRPIVELDRKKIELREGESIFIPQGAVHRLENPNDKPISIIEVQTGTYLGEDDIIRFEDDYSRS